MRLSNKGFSLIETTMAIGIMAFASVYGMNSFHTYTNAVNQAQKIGEKEDLRRMFRNSIDCAETFENNLLQCAIRGGTYISGHKANKKKFINTKNLTRRIGNYDIRLYCHIEDSAIKIHLEAKTDDMSRYERLTNIPKICGFRSRRYFATSKAMLFDFGSVDAGHKICQDSADKAGIGGEWQAVLSSRTVSSYYQLNVDGPVSNMNGAIMTVDGDGFWSKKLLAWPSFNEFGNGVSGCLHTGHIRGKSTGYDCNKLSGSGWGTRGWLPSTTNRIIKYGTWHGSGVMQCGGSSNACRIGCLEKKWYSGSAVIETH